MAFTPRLTAPEPSEKYWVHTPLGYNPCIICTPIYSSVLANCVGYAYGRFMEILGTQSCNLSTHDAGTWYPNTSDGYARGKSPQLGAVICWSKPGDAGHVAIVEQINADGSIVTSESGYGRPWAKRFWTTHRTNANGNWGQSKSYIFQGFIYNPNSSGNLVPSVADTPVISYTKDVQDATVREVSYLDTRTGPTRNRTDIALSVINFGSQLAALLNLTHTGTSSIDTSGLDSKPRIVVESLMSKGLNKAAACGIAGNIRHESNFNTAAVGDYGTSFGICQWHYGRGTAMKQYCGANWDNNLTKQLDYLWQELTTAYANSVLATLRQVPDTAEGCKIAADTFVRKFEIPADVGNESLKRQATALEYYNQIVSFSAPSISSSSTSSNLGYYEVADQVWAYFSNKQFHPAVIAGILGNMMAEVGGHTLSFTGKGYGFSTSTQWLSSNQLYYGLCMWSVKYNPSVKGMSVAQQLDYLYSTMEKEFNTYGKLYASGFNYEKFKKQTDPALAARAFCICYERPGGSTAKREEDAKTAFSWYMK